MDCHFHVDVFTTSSLMHACVLGSQWPLALKVLEDLPGQAAKPSFVVIRFHGVVMGGGKCQLIFGGLSVDQILVESWKVTFFEV